MNNKERREEQMTLEVLDAVERKNDISQRHLAQELGVALGMANSYLKRCARKGLIKISNVPPNRYLYFITPKGFAEKSRITGRYLKNSFSFYREAGDSCRSAYGHCDEQGWKRVVLCGVSELAEIAIIRSYETEIDVVGLYDPQADKDRFINKLVHNDFEELPEHDGLLLTDLLNTKVSYEQLVDRVGEDKIIVPSVLRLHIQES